MKNRYLRIERNPGFRSGVTDALRRARPGQAVRVPKGMEKRSIYVLASRARASIRIAETGRGLEVVKIKNLD